MKDTKENSVVCRVCGFEGGTLCRHIAKHGLTAEEYHGRFPGEHLIADSINESRCDKMRAKPKKSPRLECKYCGGKFNGRVQRRAHERREEQSYLHGIDGVDYLVCRVCGFRETMLGRHIGRWHHMTPDEYRGKYPDASLVLRTVIEHQVISNKGKHSKEKGEHADSVRCEKCGDVYRVRNRHYHWKQCIRDNFDKYEKGREYVVCSECRKPMLRLGTHLKQIHGWDDDRLALEANKGLKLMADVVVEKWAAKQDFAAIHKKREATHLARHGHANPFSDPAIQERIAETSRKRYGTDHPMQNEDVRARQTESAHQGPSGQEVFFDEHTCENVVYVGYGGRYIRTKVGVRKYGRVIKDLNPDFLVLPDSVLKSAVNRSQARDRLDRQRHRTRHVIELLGDWYHSEAVIGVSAEEHEREIVEAYASAGIECLALWEKDVMGRWNQIEPMVSAWIDRAVTDMNERPVFRRSTRSKVDGRKATLVCPYGSGRIFKTEVALKGWRESLKNYWRPGLKEAHDYVVCGECGTRMSKLTEHLRKSHGMTKVDYLKKHPGSLTVAGVISEAVAESCRSNPRRCV